MTYKFIQQQDTFTSNYETFGFHKDMKYPVSHVFNDNGKMRVFITNKYGKDVELVEYMFEITAKTHSASEERKRRARLDFYWENPNSQFILNQSYRYNEETSEYFDLSSVGTTFCGKGHEKTIGGIYRFKKRITPDGRWQHFDSQPNVFFKSKQEFYDYFKKVDLERFTLNDMFYVTQESLDHTWFIARLPHFDASLLDLATKDSQEILDNFIHKTKPNIDEFLSIVAKVIFDENELSDSNKKIIYNIVEAFELLPNSHGPTSVSKLIMGKQKKVIASVSHISGTCTNLKQPQAFELSNFVDSFMYFNKIFVKVDEYSDSEEWRGAYEYFGSKMINKTELIKVKTILS